MSLEMAGVGADVLGVDTDVERIGWAEAHVAPRDVAGKLSFLSDDVRSLDLHNEFDLIVSKDTFEHVDDLGGMLAVLRNALKPDGEIWVGFSPLYYSPWGDHGRTGMKLPWAHTLPRPVVLAAATRFQGRPITALTEIGLNALTPRQFRARVSVNGLRFASLLYNRGDKLLLPALSHLRRVPWLERYATVGIYAVLVTAASRSRLESR
jgi:SAM-dependent methyltransferase